MALGAGLLAAPVMASCDAGPRTVGMTDLPDGVLESCGLNGIDISRLTGLHATRIETAQAVEIYGAGDPQLAMSSWPDNIDGFRNLREDTDFFDTTRPDGGPRYHIVSAQPDADCAIVKITSALSPDAVATDTIRYDLTFELR